MFGPSAARLVEPWFPITAVSTSDIRGSASREPSAGAASWSTSAVSSFPKILLAFDASESDLLLFSRSMFSLEARSEEKGPAPSTTPSRPGRASGGGESEAEPSRGASHFSSLFRVR